MTYRNILEDEFEHRLKINAAYSLRAFARDLGLVPSQLSEILAFKIGISSKKALAVAANLGLNERESNLFKALVEIEHGRSQNIVENARKYIKSINYDSNFKGLSIDGFKFISDWEHFAILSAMELDDYDGSIAFIVGHLKLDTSTIEACIKRLLKLDMVDIKNGQFILSGEMYSTTHDIQSTALKRFHKQHILKSLNAVDRVSVDERDITCMTMAIDKNKIKAAKAMIKKFRRDMCQFLESGKKTDVYNLNIQLIPLQSMELKK